MKIFILLVIYFFCSHVQASSCVIDDDEVKKLSIEKSKDFKISITTTKDDTIAVTISAPKKINNEKLKTVSAYGETLNGKVTYYFPVNMVLEKNRFVSSYEIGSNLLDDSYIQFSYERCGMLYTYPINQTGKKEYKK